MKNLIFFTLALILGLSSLNAQKRYLWLDTGGKVFGGANLLYNAEIVDDREYTPLISAAYGASGNFGINFKEYHGFSFNLGYSAANQKYSFKLDPEGNSLSNDVKWSNVDFAIFYRYTRGINYFELGPQISFGRTVYQANNQSSYENISDLTNSPYLSGTFGFGYMAFNSDAFTTLLGLRFSYGFDEFLTNAGEADQILTTPVKFEDTSQHPASVQLVMEFNWGIGYYARTVCTGRRAFFKM